MIWRKTLTRLCVSTVAVFAAVAGLQSVALAHGDIGDSTPAAGAEVARPPKQVSLVLTEPAARGSSLVVTDGCEREVSSPIDIKRDVVEAAITGGESGRWLVSLRSISAVDGHEIEAAFTFRVAGKKDCSAEDDVEPDDTDATPAISSRAPIENPEEESSFPVVAFALGTVAVVAVALAIRRPWDKS